MYSRSLQDIQHVFQVITGYTTCIPGHYRIYNMHHTKYTIQNVIQIITSCTCMYVVPKSLQNIQQYKLYSIQYRLCTCTYAHVNDRTVSFNIRGVGMTSP